MAKVVLENVYKSFPSRSGKSAKEHTDGTDNISVLRRINLTIADGEFMVLVGPSGCGKSTLLRLIAGLEVMTGGNISVGDRLINDLPPKA
ncbi:MAG: ATP-binding cassette domain-containing protein, partial [Dolichospermum sp.]